jgi:hypothetical protein
MLSGEMTLMNGNSDSRATVAAMELLPTPRKSRHKLMVATRAHQHNSQVIDFEKPLPKR